jgi:glycosyltransferase involved in cell wall biosynthesis
MDHSVDSLALDVVVPCYNEEKTLEAHVERLHAYMSATFPQPWRITVADNASTDRTGSVADALAARLSGVVAVHLPLKGRGRALKAVWSASPAEVLAYVDEDLSTDLAALAPLVAPLASGHSDLAIGTRLSGSSRVLRGDKREFISRGYNLLLRGAFSVGFSDAQCGFKAIRSDVARRLLPLVEDDDWFFDTELLIIAERTGLRVHEVPVDWVDDQDSRVEVASTVVQDLRGMTRVGWSLARGRLPLAQLYADIGRHPLQTRKPALLGQVVRFGIIGVLSTVAFAALYLALRPALGAQPANFIALLATTVANTALNRRFTFGVRGAGAARHQLQGLVVFGLAWALTSGSLVAVHDLDPHASAGADILVLTVANLVATVLRFVLLRVWVFRQRPEPPAAHPSGALATSAGAREAHERSARS